MPISDSILKHVKFFPELLPDAAIMTLNPGSNEVFALRAMNELLCELRDLSLDSQATGGTLVQAVINGDRNQYTPAAVVLPSLLPGLDNWKVAAKSVLSYYLVNGGLALSGYRTLYNVLVKDPSVAEKIKYGMTLTDDDKALDIKLGISKSVAKGILPLSWEYMLEREIQVLNEATLATALPVVTSSAAPAFQPIIPQGADQFLVLRHLAVSPGSGTDGLTVSIQRDLGPVYLSFPAYPLYNTLTYGPIECFVPAMKQLVINLSCGSTPVTNVAIRAGIQFCKLTDIQRVRWGQLTKATAPGDVWDKVKGGVL